MDTPFGDKGDPAVYAEEKVICQRSFDRNPDTPQHLHTLRAVPAGHHRLGGNEVMGSVLSMREAEAVDLLLTVEEVAAKLKVSKDWVWDHSGRKAPYLPVIRMSDGVLRYRASQIDEFVNERERLSSLCRKRR